MMAAVPKAAPPRRLAVFTVLYCANVSRLTRSADAGRARRMTVRSLVQYS